MNKNVTVGLVVLVLVIGIGVVSSLTGSDRPWNDPKPTGAQSGLHNVSDILDTGSTKHPASPNRLMSAQEWQALEAEKYNPKNFVRGPPTPKFRSAYRRQPRPCAVLTFRRR